MNHMLYKTGDTDLPSVICDANGDVTLGLCRVCGQAEAELEDECPGLTEVGPWPTGTITAEMRETPRARNTAAERKVARVLQEAKDRAKKLTPKPSTLTYALRQDLHYRHGWTPYY